MAADETVLSFSFANFVTVVIMGAIGFALLGLGVKAWQQRKAAA